MLETSNKTFDAFYLSDEMLRALRDMAYERPTPAQVASIPLIIAGIDLIVQAQTGSGKTAAFAIPLTEMLEHNPGRVEVLVLAPTRELAKQVSDEFERLGRYKTLSATAIYGGTGYEKQYEALESAQIVCATPGRLLDHVQRGTIDLSHVRMLVLDEADEMLSMGFREDIERVIAHLPEDRQSLLFSATITDEIKALANRILFYPEFVSLSTDAVATSDVTHYYYNVRGVGRPRDLIKVLEYEEPESAIIFANTKDDTFMVTAFLKRHGYRADVLNGDLPQAEREKTLAALRAGKIDFIVATDVAARGIDISDLSHVINYVLPESAEVYIHRTGRTGRAGKKGVAISLIAPTEVATFFQVTRMYNVSMHKRELPTTQEIIEARQGRALVRLRRTLEEISGLAYGSKLAMAEQLLRHEDDEQLARENIKFVARLLALADRALAGEQAEAPRLPNGKADEAAPRARQQAQPVSDDSQPAPEAPVAEAPKQAEPAPAANEATEAPARREARAARAAEIMSEDTAPEPARETTARERKRPAAEAPVDEPAAAEPIEVAPPAPEPEQAPKPEAKPAPTAPPAGERRPKRTRTRRLTSADERPATAEVPVSVVQEVVAPTDETGENEPSAAGLRKLYVNVGRDQFEDPQDVVDMICYMAGIDPEDLGEVSLETTYSYVFVRRDYFHDVIAALHQQEWQGTRLSAEPARK